MGDMIRRVPANWEHPKREDGSWQPLYDIDYETALAQWLENHYLWLEGRHRYQLENPDQTKEYKYYAEFEEDAPEVAFHRPKWKDEERTHYQLYETITEGTPRTPVFASEEDLRKYCEEFDRAVVTGEKRN